MVNTWQGEKTSGGIKYPALNRITPEKLPGEAVNFQSEQIAPGFFTVLVRVYPCVRCGQDMLPHTGGTFNAWQSLQGFNLKQPGSMTNKDGYFCVDCEKIVKGMSRRCWLCTAILPTEDDIHFIFGQWNPPRYLCTSCYGAVPANQWDRAVNELIQGG